VNVPPGPRWLSPRLMAHDFPLRPDLQVRMYLPPDLTVDEAERLIAIVRSLAFSDPDQNNGAVVSDDG